ncbi:MAG: tripartite tricarboxylate transporter TctA family protein [Deltaproteobacteria bacterium]|nr:tripartite tricarboxylate transporter TctA family protein [Deltaproteobacteria bacterium]
MFIFPGVSWGSEESYLDALSNLAFGFSIFLQPANLAYCFVGVLLGTLVGVLPGLGPSATISLLLPIIFHASPVSSIIMLAGICYGAQYGGSTTSILLNIPGEASSVITCLDGYQMAKQGRAGPALGIAAFGSFIAGTVGVCGLMLLGPTLANLALRFGPPEFFSLAFMSLTLVTYVSKGSLIRSLIMACIGLVMSTVGMDPITSRSRFTFGLPSLLDGFELVYVAMGFFGLSEVFINLGQSMNQEIIQTKIKGLLPTRQDWRDSAKPIARGTVLGFFLGILPGFGAAITTFVSYAIEKKFSKHPEKFGTGTIEGVAGPEAANNAASSGTFIPLLSLGIPVNPSTAILIGALMILGLQPGPLLISTRPDLFWGVIASMYMGNLMLVVLNLPLIGLWVQILKVPYSLLYVFIVLICQIGAYSVNNDVNDVLLINIFGLFGYLMKRYQFEGAPLILGLVLGRMFENAMRRSLLISDGNPLIFFTRPISAVFLVIALFFLISPMLTKKKIGEKAIDTKE